MIRNIVQGLCGCFITVFFLSECLGADPGDAYQVLQTGFAISTTQRHEWFPRIQYNTQEDEFLVVWNTSGKLRSACPSGDEYECENSFHSVHAQRMSSQGVLLGDALTLSPIEGLRDNVSWKCMPRVAYNPSANQYMIVYTVGLQPPSTQLNEAFRVIIDHEGLIKFGPESLYPTQWNANHPDVAFNAARRQYLAVYNDKYVFTGRDGIDTVGFILQDNGTISSGPLRIGSGSGAHFAPSVNYNSTDDTYMIAWEDFRHAWGQWYYGPNDIYGAVLNAAGSMTADIPVVEDCGEPDAGYQFIPGIAYNPDDNEFMVAWTDTRLSLCFGAIMGRIFHGDGTPVGPEFVIADALGMQSAASMVYVQKERKYFVVWHDGRNVFDADIYARWLSADGEPVGDAIPIYVGIGDQEYPAVAYSPAADSFLIAWRDLFSPADHIPVGPGANMAPEQKADIRAAVYGSK